MLEVLRGFLSRLSGEAWTVSVAPEYHDNVPHKDILRIEARDSVTGGYAYALVCTGDFAASTTGNWRLPPEAPRDKLWCLGDVCPVWPKRPEGATRAVMSRVAQVADQGGIWVLAYSDTKLNRHFYAALRRYGFVSFDRERPQMLTRLPRPPDSSPSPSPDSTLAGVTIGRSSPEG